MMVGDCLHAAAAEQHNRMHDRKGLVHPIVWLI